jgi:hypothetical protein
MNKEKKDTKRTSFGEYIDAIEKQLQEGFEGVISEINPITNTDFFGDEGSYDNKEGIAVTIVIHGDIDTEFTQWFSKPQATGYKQSNIFKFKQKYGKVPEVGMSVKCYVDDNNFYRIEF